MNVALRTIECFAGVGMLGVGLHAGLGHLGIETRTVCYVEREAFAASVMAARMAEGALDDAPVWTDVTTFDAAAWRGSVDCVIGGFPCQDLSLAGRRAGLDGKRSGLFFAILDIAHACGARYLFLENVAGIASATASVVDEAEGELDERAAARVLGELADRGWHAEWLTLRASDVGASHQRERWFCWAWRQLANTGGERRQQIAGSISPHERTQARPEGSGSGNNFKPSSKSKGLGDASIQRLQEPGQCGQRKLSAEVGSGLHHRPEQSGSELAHPTQHGRHQGRTEPGRKQGRPDAAECGGAVACEFCGYEFDVDQLGRYGCPNCNGEGLDDVADPSGPRREGRELGRALHGDGGGAQAHGPTEQLCRPLFAPGPADPAWPDILAQRPHLAPAIEAPEPSLRRMADGLASGPHDSRTQRLRAIGNGVVALQAAAAVVVLVRRMMEPA